LAQDISEFLGKKFEGVKGQDAINKLMKEKQGHVSDAFYRDDLGSITLIWGNEDAGLAHIIKRRVTQGIDIKSFLSDLNEVIEKGKISKGRDGNFEILGAGKIAIISPDFKGNKIAFVLTAFKTRKKA
jgi:hypothetical protein